MSLKHSQAIPDTEDRQQQERKPVRPPQRRNRQYPGVYFIPVIAVLLVVYLVPLVYTVWLSLHDTTFFKVGAFSGLKSFQRLFTDGLLITNTVNTLLYTLGSLLIALPLGFFSALLLNQITRLKRLARSLLLLPWLMSQATVGLIWMWFLNPSYGPLPYLLKLMGADEVTVFSDPGLALTVLIFVTAWWSYPQAMLFFMGALQMIPGELKESIQLDGGGVWHAFRYITIPFIRNTAVTVAMILIMNYLQMVTIMLVTTRGGPLNATETISLRIYNQMFTNFKMSDASASALFLFAINIVLTIVVVRMRRREEF